MFAILHFVAVKKPWLGNTLALSETVRSEVVSLLPLTVRQPNVLGGAYGGTKAKPLAPCCRRLCLFEPLLFMTPAVSRRPGATYYFSILIMRVVVAPQASQV
jgi:hypothetical protein